MVNYYTITQTNSYLNNKIDKIQTTADNKKYIII